MMDATPVISPDARMDQATMMLVAFALLLIVETYFGTIMRTKSDSKNKIYFFTCIAITFTAFFWLLTKTLNEG